MKFKNVKTADPLSSVYEGSNPMESSTVFVVNENSNLVLSLQPLQTVHRLSVQKKNP